MNRDQNGTETMNAMEAMEMNLPLQDMVRKFTQLVDEAGADEDRILVHGKTLLAELIAADDWLPEACAVPHPQYYRQYLLHLDPQQRFSIVSFVWGPGQKTPVHDHTVWGLVGVLQGAEYCERYALAGDDEPMRLLGGEMLEPGRIDSVSPAIGDIHRVSNAFVDRVSISIHVYGADIGRVKRHVYDPSSGEMREFISGYANIELASAKT